MRPKFKRFVKKDDKTFMNPLEFADKHTLGSLTIIAVIDEDKAADLNHNLSSDYGYEYAVDLVVFVEYKYFGERPRQGTVLLFDNKQYRILKVYANMGIYELHLSLEVGR